MIARNRDLTYEPHCRTLWFAAAALVILAMTPRFVGATNAESAANRLIEPNDPSVHARRIALPTVGSSAGGGRCCTSVGGLADRSLATEASLLFDTSHFPPRWKCGSWSASLGWTHIISDIVIFLAYVTIPTTLIIFVRKRKDVPFHGLFFLFGAFIVFCGLTHLMEATIFYWPAYRFAGVLKICTAIVSVVTSATLIRVIPRALKFKSPTQLQKFVAKQTLELRQTNEALIRTNKQLANANLVAEQANRTKSAFLANMSHEIRTPMTAILGFAEIISDADHHDPEVKNAIETVRRNGNHLLTVVNDILDLSKIETGHLSIESVPAAPKTLIEDACLLYQGQCAMKGLSLQVDISPAIPLVLLSDPTRLRQIVTNLIANAVKFTDNGSIRVFAKMTTLEKTESLCVDVIDSGIGMSDEQQARVFKPFGQGDASTTRRFGGTGLGLTISRRLAELLGGTLHIEKSAPKSGSHFRLLLPIEHCDSQDASEATTTPPEVSPDVAQSPRIAEKLLDGRHILLVDDGVDNQRLFSILLRNAGADVTIVENGKDAFERATAALNTNQPFELILMDMQMPIMDGFTATRKLREASFSGPIIALTAYAMTADRESCIEAGCNDYISKPTQRAELLDVITRHLSEVTAK